MLKRIPLSDISIRPFKVYKEWNFNNNSKEIDILFAENTGILSNTTTNSENLSFNRYALWGQLRGMFYNGNEDNPFLRFGSKRPDYIENQQNKDRVLNSEAKIISIPQKYIGEGIKPNSVEFIENGISYGDDGYGNFIRTGGSSIFVTSVNVENQTFIFKDTAGNTYNCFLDTNDFFLDLENSVMYLIYDGVNYFIEVANFDLETGIMNVVDIAFLPEEVKFEKYGNVFYQQGLITVTKNTTLLLVDEWQLFYNSTNTIYEHEYLLVTNPDEFNVSTNPTAIAEVGKEEEEWETLDESYSKVSSYKTKVQTNPGVKYIRQFATNETGDEIDYRYQSQINPNVYGGFEQIELSGSVDITGSFLAPYITTIGLYNDDCELLAVAKLPRPIKSLPTVNYNFLVRFDT